jgi:hypothetical protein
MAMTALYVHHVLQHFTEGFFPETSELLDLDGPIEDDDIGETVGYLGRGHLSPAIAVSGNVLRAAVGPHCPTGLFIASALASAARASSIIGRSSGSGVRTVSVKICQ